MKRIIYLFLMLPLCSLASGSNGIDKSDIERARDFINEYPIIDHELDESGLVDLWLRVDGLHNLISLWRNDPELFKKLGPENPSHWRWHIRKRIWSHLLHAKYTGENERVQALTAMIRLHAKFAEYYMNNKIRYSYYADIVEYVEANGSHLAVQLKDIYAKTVERSKDK